MMCVGYTDVCVCERVREWMCPVVDVIDICRRYLIVVNIFWVVLFFFTDNYGFSYLPPELYLVFSCGYFGVFSFFSRTIMFFGVTLIFIFFGVTLIFIIFWCNLVTYCS